LQNPRTAVKRDWLALAPVLGFAAIYLAADVALNKFAFADGWTIIWPLNGVTVALLIMRPRRTWPYLLLGVEIGTGIGEYLCEDFSVWMEFLQRICSVVLVVTCAWLLPPFDGLEEWLSKPRIFVKILVALIVGPGISGLMASMLFHVVKGQSYLVAFDNWGAADALGVATTMPLVLAFRSPQMRALFAPGAVLKTAGTLLVVFAGAALVFSVSRYPLVCLLFPLSLFADLLLGFAGSAITVAGVCLIAMYFTTRGIGPFGAWAPDLWVPGNLALQIFFGFQMAALFPVSVLFMERRKMAEELRLTNARLTVLAAVDGLTSIANRRSFDERLAEEWRRAARQQTPLSIAMIDLDYFKQFNDHYGHVAGDNCLQALAEVLTSQLHRHPEMMVARFGGEEFAMLLPNTAADAAATVAERIRAVVYSLAIPHVGSSWRFITISIGHATLTPSPGQPQSELIKLADAGLYQAKHTGRNRIEAIGSIGAFLAAKDRIDFGATGRNRVMRMLGGGER
jgi:diguanylate cyclase (GGDEF)-like protein